MKYSTKFDPRAAWKAGDYVQAGALIYESIPRILRPHWARQVLSLFCTRMLTPAPVQTVIDISIDECRWGEAHTAFQNVRRLALDGDHDARSSGLLILAENVAKVTYNATGFAAPFDHNSGWKIARDAHDLLEDIRDEEFTLAVLEALFPAQYRPQLRT